jgi:hypothetical protein
VRALVLTTLARCALVAVALPVATPVLRRVDRSMPQRQPDSPAGDALQRAASGLDILSGRRTPNR